MKGLNRKKRAAAFLAAVMIFTGSYASAEDLAVNSADAATVSETGAEVIAEPPVEQITEPPAETQPPATEPPVTEAPVTEPPMTEPPVTEPPAAEPPVTEPPVTEAPVTEPPATEPPVTEPPTEAPVTEPPTEAPVTEAPTEAQTQPQTQQSTEAQTQPQTQPVQQTESSAPQTEAQKETEEPGTYTWEKDDVTAKVKMPDQITLPEDAVLELAKEQDENYKKDLELLEKYVKDVSFGEYLIYDIHFETADGQEISLDSFLDEDGKLPAEIEVELTFEEPVFQKQNLKNEDVAVYHIRDLTEKQLAEEKALLESEGQEAEPDAQKPVELKAEPELTDAKDGVESISFKTDGFSDFVIALTEPAPETESETETETEAVTESETETETEAVTETETETEAVTESETETETEAVTESETETETEAVTESETETETEAVTESETETEAVTESETETETTPVTETETETTPVTETETETTPVTETETETETETTPETEPVTETEHVNIIPIANPDPVEAEAAAHQIELRIKQAGTFAQTANDYTIQVRVPGDDMFKDVELWVTGEDGSTATQMGSAQYSVTGENGESVLRIPVSQLAGTEPGIYSLKNLPNGVYTIDGGGSYFAKNGTAIELRNWDQNKGYTSVYQLNGKNDDGTPTGDPIYDYKPIAVTISDDSPQNQNVEITNVYTQASVKLTDSATAANAISGGVFQLTFENNTFLTGTITTGKDGLATVNGLPISINAEERPEGTTADLNTYKWTLQSYPNTYVAPLSNTQTFTLTEGKPTSTDAAIQLSPTMVQILARDAGTNKDIARGRVNMTIQEKGNTSASLTRQNGDTLTALLEVGKTYVITQAANVSGYALTKRTAEITVGNNARVQTVWTENTPTKLRLTAWDEDTNKALEDAANITYAIEEKGGKAVGTSFINGEVVTGRLDVGKTYVVTQTARKYGYVITAETAEVTIRNDGKEQTAVTRNTPTVVNVAARRASDGTYLSGGSMEIADSTGEVLWGEGPMEGKVYTMKGYFEPGTYTMTETTMPNGHYTFTTSTTFTVGSQANNCMVSAFIDHVTVKIRIYRRAYDMYPTVNGKDVRYMLPGATMQIRDEYGNVVDEWVTTENYYLCEGKLNVGQKYTVVETVTPEGYVPFGEGTFSTVLGEPVGNNGRTVVEIMKDGDDAGRITPSVSVQGPKQLGRIRVAKRVFYRGSAIKVNRTFYCALFTDSAKTQIYKEAGVQPLQMTTSSGVYVTADFENLPPGIYYVGETDANGRLISGRESSPYFTISYTNNERIVLGSRGSGIGEIVNEYQATPSGGYSEVTPEELEQSYADEYANYGGSAEASSSYAAGDTTNADPVTTGDPTNVIPYVAAAAVALIAVLGAVIYRRKRKN